MLLWLLEAGKVSGMSGMHWERLCLVLQCGRWGRMCSWDTAARCEYESRGLVDGRSGLKIGGDLTEIKADSPGPIPMSGSSCTGACDRGGDRTEGLYMALLGAPEQSLRATALPRAHVAIFTRVRRPLLTEASRSLHAQHRNSWPSTSPILASSSFRHVCSTQTH